MGSSPKQPESSDELVELIMKYFVFKLNSKFPYNELIKRLQSNQKFTQKFEIEGKTLAKILVDLEIKAIDD